MNAKHLMVGDGRGFRVTVIADSFHVVTGSRLMTLALRYPRFIHSELMTHRVFSRNASSSRAIPSKRMIDAVRNDPAGFVHIGANQRGMQAAGEVDAGTRGKFEEEWEALARLTATFVERWTEVYGIHKQVANRVLEPWQWMETLVTASEWDNFFTLRVHPDAQPEFRHLASYVRQAYEESIPAYLKIGEWHMPFVQRRMESTHHRSDTGAALIRSAACCAWVSYRMPGLDEEPTFEKCLDTFRKLTGTPMHASPLEHQAYANLLDGKLGRNFAPEWAQHRALREQGLIIAEDLCNTN